MEDVQLGRRRYQVRLARTIRSSSTTSIIPFVIHAPTSTPPASSSSPASVAVHAPVAAVDRLGGGGIVREAWEARVGLQVEGGEGGGGGREVVEGVSFEGLGKGGTGRRAAGSRGVG